MYSASMNCKQAEMAHRDAIDRFLAEIGPRWAEDVSGNVECVVEAYGPILRAAPRTGVGVVRDIAYGADPRQRLDVYARPGLHGRPVVLFVHGGAFVEGDRDRTEEVYSNVLYYFARHDIVGVNVEYRLAPDHRYPAAAEDVARAVAWAAEHIEGFGGDPRNLFLMGHSAGAAHTGSYGYDPRFRDEKMHCRISGMIVVSGRVRVDNAADNPNARKVEAYYGTDSSIYDSVSPVSHVSQDSPPTFIAFAEFENPKLDLYCLELARALAREQGHEPEVMRLMGHNHTSIVAHLNTEEGGLGLAIRNFIEAHSRKTSAAR